MSPNTVIGHLAIISRCVDSAMKSGLIRLNPTKIIDRPKRVKFTGAKYLTEEGINPVIKAVEGTFLYDIVYLLFFTV